MHVNSCESATHSSVPPNVSNEHFHGLVVSLCGTGCDKLDWDRFHRGHRACPATRTGLQRGYMTCPWDRDMSLLTFPSPSGTGLVQAACLSHWDKHNLSQSVCPTGTGCACPSGTGLVQVPPFQSWHLTKLRVIPYQKTKGVLIEFGNSLSKIGLELVKNRDSKSIFFH